MKFQAIDEFTHFSFDDSVIQSLRLEGKNLVFTLAGAVVKAENTQNARFQDMYCGEIILRLENVEIVRIVKEGYKYYDADGNLQESIPDQEVTAPEQSSVLERCAEGTIFTTVEEMKEGKEIYEFGIDVPKLEDEEEVDTFWLCVSFEKFVAMWDRYQVPQGND